MKKGKERESDGKLGSRWERAVIGVSTFFSKSADVFDSSIGTDQWEWAIDDKIHNGYLESLCMQ
jgi:hypothetical protein